MITPGEEAWRIHTVGGPGIDRVEYVDVAAGEFRGARFRDGRLDSCVFVGAGRHLAARDWIATLFAPDATLPDSRAAILVGRPSAPRPDLGPMVCACFGVRRDSILDAIVAGDLASVDAVGAATSAGTNCGSCRPELAILLRDASRKVAA